MKKVLKIMIIVLLVSFMPLLSSCGKGREINIDEAKKIYKEITRYQNENSEDLDKLSFSLKIKQVYKNNDTRSITEIDIALKGKDQYLRNKENGKIISEDYYYVIVDNYFHNGQEINQSNYGHLDLIYYQYYKYYNSSIYRAFYDYNIESSEYLYHFYSSGKGNLVVEKKSRLSTKKYLETITYKNNIFSNYNLTSEGKNSSRSESISIKYNIEIDNPYK